MGSGGDISRMGCDTPSIRVKEIKLGTDMVYLSGSAIQGRALVCSISLQKCCHEEVKIQFRLVHLLDGTKPFHR